MPVTSHLHTPHPMMQCQNIGIRVANRILVQGVSFDVMAGDVQVLKGFNGIGKTTLLKVCAGLKKPYVGHVVVNAASLVYLSAQPAFLYDHSAYENIKFLCGCYQHMPSSDKITGACQKVSLTPEHINTPARLLSTGQKQRLVLALLQLLQPEVVLWDEPSNGLDGSGKVLFFQTIQRLQEEHNTAFVLASHDPEILKTYEKHWDLVGYHRQIQEGNQGIGKTLSYQDFE